MGRSPKPINFTTRKLNKIYELRSKGATYEQLAKYLKLKNRQAFYYYLKNNELLAQVVKDADEAKMESLRSQTLNMIQARIAPQNRTKTTITDIFDGEGNLKGHQVKTTKYVEEPKSSELIFILEHLFKTFSKDSNGKETNEKQERRLINELNKYRGLD